MESYELRDRRPSAVRAGPATHELGEDAPDYKEATSTVTDLKHPGGPGAEGPDLDPAPVVGQVGEVNELKRNLQGRHLQMIAILSLPSSSCCRANLANITLGWCYWCWSLRWCRWCSKLWRPSFSRHLFHDHRVRRDSSSPVKQTRLFLRSSQWNSRHFTFLLIPP